MSDFQNKRTKEQMEEEARLAAEAMLRAETAGEDEDDGRGRRDYIAKLRTGEDIKAKTDMGLSAAFERLKGKHGGYVSDKKFLNGWVYGTADGMAKISLLWIDGKGGRGVETHLFEHYFWVRTADVSGRARTLLRKWKDGCGVGRRAFKVRRWDVDPNYPEWTRVFVNTPPDYFNARTYLTDRTGHYVTDCRIDGKVRKVSARSPSLNCADELDKRGIKTWEGDLSPVRRFVADVPINYPDAGDFSETYFDIETDDRADDVFTNLGKYRILSIGWEDKDGHAGAMLLEEDSDEAERRMLTRFRDQVLRKTDVLFTWNGYQFDYFYLWERMRKLGVEWKWWELVFADLLPVFKRYHFRAGSKNTSLALGKIGAAVLGDEEGGKIDLRDELDQKHPGWRQDGSPAGTWSAWWRDPELLLKYNVKDCTILRKLERFTGYAHLDFTFSKIGNCFANDYHISTKIDGLMVRKGLVDGQHFPTVFKDREEAEAEARGDGPAHEGGYVHEPVRGVHETVCAFDFKSLYPSMITTFNLSPDTFVAPADRHLYAPEELITTVVGTTFLRPRRLEDGEDGKPRWDRVGFIPQMFVETLERRKTYTRLQETVEVGSDMFLHYYRLAYSYKRLGLSFYGELGNPRSRFYNPDCGRSVTLSGQHYIKETMREAEVLGYHALYGDTDSMYVKMDPAEAPAFLEHVHAMYLTWLEAWNAPRERTTVELEFEDVYGRIVLINKKRYFGRLVYHKGQPANHLEIKGLETMRSDGVEMGRELQTAVMKAIAFEEAGAEEVLNIVRESRDRVLERRVTLEELTCVAGLTKDPSRYKPCPPHARVALGMKRRGIEWYVGMKVPFVWVRGTYIPRPEPEPDLSFAENVRRHLEWEKAEAASAKRHKKPPDPEPVWTEDYDAAECPYDAEYYWSSKVYPPSLRIVEVAFPGVDWVGLSGAEAGKRDRRLSAYRKALLDPAKRDAACAKIAADGALTGEQRAELSAFYMTNVLCGRPVSG